LGRPRLRKKRRGDLSKSTKRNRAKGFGLSRESRNREEPLKYSSLLLSQKASRGEMENKKELSQEKEIEDSWVTHKNLYELGGESGAKLSKTSGIE